MPQKTDERQRPTFAARQLKVMSEQLARIGSWVEHLVKARTRHSVHSPFVYKLPTVGDISGLTFKDFFCDFRSKHFIDKDYYGEVQVAYRCFSERVITVKKGPDDMEKFRDVLWQSNIEHKSEQFRNERKVITHEVFKVRCDFRVQAKIEGDHEPSHRLAAEALSDVDLASRLAGASICRLR